MMTPVKVPYLCGGILFSLILQARKARTKARDKFNSGSDGLNDTDVMMGLVEVVTGDSFASSQGKTFAKCTTQFKTCQDYGTTYIPFTDASVISSFHSSLKQKDSDLLNRMSEFISKYINEMRSEWLVKALFEVIQNDEEITQDTAFFISLEKTVVKDELENVTEIELPIFLLSVLGFIITERSDNTKGRPTFEAWHTQSGPKSPWKYKADIGSSITRIITVKTKCELLEPRVVDTVSLESQNSDREKKAQKEFIEIPEEQPSDEFPYSSEDKLLLQEFTTDYDEIMVVLIGEKYAESLIDMTLPRKIKDLYENKWISKADTFADPSLKSYVFGLLGELNNISNSLLVNGSVTPSLGNARTKIRNLYVKLHPDQFAGAFPYDAFIDDWNDGEF